MPRIEVSRSHTLDIQEARQRADRIGKELAQKYGLECSWNGDRRLAFRRTGVQGEVQLKDGSVTVQVDLSFVLSPLRTKVEQALREGLEKEFK